MFGLKPARRWQPAYYPFGKEELLRRTLAKIELAVKGPVFGCRMCGNCILQETALICPMECPKGIRNGPCGGITPDKKCYIDRTRKCVWYAIYSRSFKKGRQEKLLEIMPPLDFSKAGKETWGDVFKQIKKTGTGNFIFGIISGNKTHRNDVWESVFRTVRQPSWWKGDSDYHPPGYSEPLSALEKKLRSGSFVFATELSPPLSTGTARLKNDIEVVKPWVTAINFTDSASVIPKMSSLACCVTTCSLGAEPVLQIAARDTTRTGLQSDVVGINSLGIRNVLCVSGDSAKIGPGPNATMDILDIDSVQMLWILRKMRDEGVYLDGRKMKDPPKYFLGAATTPFASDPAYQAIRDQKKVNAGAQFLQTNLIFEPDKLDAWLEELDKRDTLDKVFILAGVAPLKSLKQARYLNINVPGVNVPEKILSRIGRSGEKAPEEGVQIALEIIDKIKVKKGIHGIHLMTMGWETVVERIVRETN